MLRLLLDANLSPELARQIQRHHPEIPIRHLNTWEAGCYRHRADWEVLRQAQAEGLTLVTCDISSIPALLQEWGGRGLSHGGVIFVSQRYASRSALGVLQRSLSQLWQTQGSLDWTDTVLFLEPAEACLSLDPGGRPSALRIENQNVDPPILPHRVV